MTSATSVVPSLSQETSEPKTKILSRPLFYIGAGLALLGALLVALAITCLLARAAYAADAVADVVADVVADAGADAGADEFGSPEADKFAGFLADIGSASVTILTEEQPSEEVRQEKFVTLFTDSFDTLALSRFVLARHWRAASDEQRSEFSAVFPTVLGKRFVPLLQVENVSSVRWVVEDVVQNERFPQIYQAKVSVVLPNGRAVNTEWRGYLRPDMEFVVLDFKAEGVSLGFALREEYGAIIARKGIDGLTDALKQTVSR